MKKTAPIDNSELKQKILQTVASIPAGKVASYGQVAKLCGYPGHARYVGTLLKKLPKNSKLPWYRVINSKGEISFPLGSEAYYRQQTKLSKEGIKVEAGKISMKVYGWII